MVRACGYPTEGAPCEQPEQHPAGTAAGKPLCYYHTKIEAGLAQTIASQFSEEETRALFEGRLHGDGRRLDHWVIEDPIPRWSAAS